MEHSIAGMIDNLFSIDVGVAGYLIAGTVYFVFGVLLLTGWKARHSGAYLVSAVLISVFWSFCLAAVAIKTYDFPFSTYYLLECFKVSAWLLVLMALLNAFAKNTPIPRMSLGAVASLIVCVSSLLIFAVLFLGDRSPVDEPAGLLPLTSLLGLSLFGFVLVEQVYRNTPDVKRWSVKFLCVGLGAMFAYDIFLYSNAVLFRQLDMEYWKARGFINALVVPLMAVSVARSPQLALNIFVSRHVVFYTTALTGVGLYLLAMAVGGYYMRAYGGTWGGLMQTIFLFGAGLLLVLIMLSSKARARLRVFIVKHFFSNKYDYRIEWLKLINTLSKPSDQFDLQQRAIICLAQIISARGGCLWLLNNSGSYELQARWNMKSPGHASENAAGEFARFFQDKHWVVDLHESLPAGFSKPGWLQSLKDAWLVVPLSHEKNLFGFIVLESHESVTQHLTWEDTDLLKTVGRQITSYLALEKAAEELAESKQFDAYNKLATFVIHDLKNLVSQLSLVTQNAVQHMHNPLFIKDTVLTIDNCVNKMNKLLLQIRADGNSMPKSEQINFIEFIKSVIAECSNKAPVPELDIRNEALWLSADRVRLAMAVRHLISNAQDAVDGNGGMVRINVERADNLCRLEVSDDGCGMSEDFIRNRLFRPFETTKAGKGMGVGAYEVKEYIQSIGGSIEVVSEINKGTTFTILLPLCSESENSVYKPSVIEVANG